MDDQLDVSMRTAGDLEGWTVNCYREEYQCVLRTLSDGFQARPIGINRWFKSNQCVCLQDRTVMPEARLDNCLHWANLSSGHIGCNCSAGSFTESPTYPTPNSPCFCSPSWIFVAFAPSNKATLRNED